MTAVKIKKHQFTGLSKVYSRDPDGFAAILRSMAPATQVPGLSPLYVGPGPAEYPQNCVPTNFLKSEIYDTTVFSIQGVIACPIPVPAARGSRLAIAR